MNIADKLSRDRFKVIVVQWSRRHNTYIVTPDWSFSLETASNQCCSERSFSSLRRIKSYLSSSMTQSRLSSIMLLHVHKDLTDQIEDQINLIDVANNFVDNKLDHRSTVFGRFMELEFKGICVCSSCSKVTRCMKCME